MKTLNKFLLPVMIAASFSISAGSQNHAMMDGQDHAMMDGQNGQKMGVMGDYHARSMMMDQIVEDPEMRQEMMHKMMQSMDMQQMMNDPELKSRMQRHVSMMQAMLDSDGMDSATMKEMMGNPKMMSMMKTHMMCAQITDGEMMGEHVMKNGEEHTH